MEVVNNRITGDKVQEFVKATSFGGAIKPPDSIIIHYTAGTSGKSTVRYLSGKSAKVSAHLVVDESGEVTQMVDFNRKGYHAGKSSFGGRTGYNAYSIGIEISNPGWLKKAGSGFANAYGGKVAPDMVFEGKHRNYPKPRTMFWHKYPEAQVKAVFDICEALCNAYDIREILGHEEIAPARKTDPGPAFPLDELRDKFIKKIEVISLSGKNGKVNEKLNIRVSPKSAATQAGRPIPAGTVVELIEEAGDWYHVNEEIIGWVAGKYIEEDNSDDYGDAHVTANNLNIRASNSTSAGKVTAEPLHKNTRVDIIEKAEDWLQVKVRLTGWVMKKFVSVV